MTTFSGLVGIVFTFPVIFASLSLSSQGDVLIHQFAGSHRFLRQHADPNRGERSCANFAGTADLRASLFEHDLDATSSILT
jgi:hypothetical protein